MGLGSRGRGVWNWGGPAGRASIWRARQGAGGTRLRPSRLSTLPHARALTLPPPPLPPPPPPDYLTKVAVTGRASTALTVGDIMTSQSRLLTAAPEASVVEVMTTMVAHNIRHVPVVSGGAFLGMLSMRDVVSTVVDEHNEEVGRLQDYIQGGY